MSPWREWQSNPPHNHSTCVKSGFECDPDEGFVLYRYPYNEVAPGEILNERRRDPYMCEKLFVFEQGVKTFIDWSQPCKDNTSPHENHKWCRLYIMEPIAWIPLRNVLAILERKYHG